MKQSFNKVARYTGYIDYVNETKWIYLGPSIQV
jgi:hypothetical protein